MHRTVVMCAKAQHIHSTFCNDGIDKQYSPSAMDGDNNNPSDT